MKRPLMSFWLLVVLVVLLAWIPYKVEDKYEDSMLQFFNDTIKFQPADQLACTDIEQNHRYFCAVLTNKDILTAWCNEHNCILY